MPWETRSLWEARQSLVEAALRQVQSLAQRCREAGVSRKTGYQWLHRFPTEGTPGLRDRSRRPLHSPNRTPRWRYTRYADGGEELYNEDRDPYEWTNLASRDAEFDALKAELRRFLPAEN